MVALKTECRLLLPEDEMTSFGRLGFQPLHYLRIRGAEGAHDVLLPYQTLRG